MSGPRRPDASGHERDVAAEEPVRSLVREALAADEPRDPPAFSDVYAAARRRHAAAGARTDGATTPSTRRPRLLAGACAGAAVLAVALVIVRPWGGAVDAPASALEDFPGAATAPTPEVSVAERDPDYVAALALRRSMRTRTPLDAMAASLPSTVARGLPALPEYRYPLLPEDAPFGATSPSRNPS